MERLLPLPEDRVPPAKKRSSDRDRRDRRGDRTPDRRKSAERRDNDKDQRSYDRNYDSRSTTDRTYDSSRETREYDREREYAAALAIRIRETERRVVDDKDYDSPYDKMSSHDERSRYNMDIDEPTHYNENSRGDDRHLLESVGGSGRGEYGEERRSRRDLWDGGRDERELER